MSARDWKNMLTSAQEGNLELVKYYIELGVNPNYQHPELLTTPLIESIAAEHIGVVEYLLNHGADPNLKAGFSQDSPLSVAQSTKNQELIALIQQYLPKEKALFSWVKALLLQCFRPIIRRFNI